MKKRIHISDRKELEQTNLRKVQKTEFMGNKQMRSVISFPKQQFIYSMEDVETSGL